MNFIRFTRTLDGFPLQELFGDLTNFSWVSTRYTFYNLGLFKTFKVNKCKCFHLRNPLGMSETLGGHRNVFSTMAFPRSMVCLGS